MTSIPSLADRQEQAPRRHEAADLGDLPVWNRAASFVLSFEQRQVGGQVERRLVAEQTELEPEHEGPPATWPGWDCAGICDWLRHRIGAAPPAGLEAAASSAASAAVELAPSEAAARPAPRLRFENVAVVDESGQVTALRQGRLMTETLQCTLPARLEVEVLGAAPDREVRVALRFRRPAGPGWSPLEPVSAPGTGPAQLELSGVAPGQYQARLVAWAPDGSAEPVGLDLGVLGIRTAAR